MAKGTRAYSLKYASRSDENCFSTCFANSLLLLASANEFNSFAFETGSLRIRILYSTMLSIQLIAPIVSYGYSSSLPASVVSSTFALWALISETSTKSYTVLPCKLEKFVFFNSMRFITLYCYTIILLFASAKVRNFFDMVKKKQITSK